MSETVSGVIQEIVTRQVAGGKTAYNVVVGGQSYGAGLYAPKASQGDYVTFQVDDSRGYKNVARGTLKVSANKPAPTEAAPATKTSYTSGSKTSSFDARQETISRQAASNTAIAYLSMLVANEALPLPAAGAKANSGKRQEAMDAYLAQYTKHFYESNTGAVFVDITPESGEASDTEVEEDALPEDEAWQ